MPLTLHHLNKSQSERILFLLEELELPYELRLHERNPVTALAPESLKAVHAAGTAPVLVDEPPNPNGDARVALAESGAIVEYILSAYAPDGRLAVRVGEPGFADYLNFLHYVNGTLQPALSRLNMLARAGVPDDHMVAKFVRGKIDAGLPQIDEALQRSGAYLAGPRLTAADCMMVFTLTTMRGFVPTDLSPYPHILAYLQRIGERPAYRRAMAKGDPELEPMLGANVEKFYFGDKNVK